jgi:hypothetical protein
MTAWLHRAEDHVANIGRIPVDEEISEGQTVYDSGL